MRMWLKLLLFICLACRRKLDVEDVYIENYCPYCYESKQEYEEDIIQK